MQVEEHDPQIQTLVKLCGSTAYEQGITPAHIAMPNLRHLRNTGLFVVWPLNIVLGPRKSWKASESFLELSLSLNSSEWF